MSRVRIGPWDWRYLIGFNKSIGTTVLGNIKSIQNISEKKVYLNIYELFYNYISAINLVESIQKNGLEYNSVATLLRKKHLFVLNDNTIQFLKNELTLIYGDKSELLIDIVLANNSSKTNFNTNEYFSLIFDSVFLNEIKIQNVNNEIMPVEDKFDISDFEGIVEQLSIKYKNITAHYGFDFIYSIQAGDSFAEYWPKQLSGTKENQLIIYKNKGNLCKSNMELTFAHEVFPGHGYYYKIQNESNYSFCDDGALFHLEGWATYAEWISRHNPRSEYNKKNGKNLATIYLNSCNGSFDTLNKYYKSQMYTLEQIKYYRINYEHMPGFIEAYYLGALWFEKYLRISEPEEFSQFMSGKSWGDLFKLW